MSPLTAQAQGSDLLHNAEDTITGYHPPPPPPPFRFLHVERDFSERRRRAGLGARANLSIFRRAISQKFGVPGSLARFCGEIHGTPPNTPGACELDGSQLSIEMVGYSGQVVSFYLTDFF